MIKRENYLQKIRPFYESDLVKVITGIRRCGKSVVLEQIMSKIREKTDNILYLNFEKTADLLKVSDAISLVKYVNDNKKDSKCYLFFDEIQKVKNWYIAIKDLRLENASIFITGSNFKLLSSEITTLLSGRYVDFRIRTFVFSEIEEYFKLQNKTASVEDYLIWGGFPARFLYGDIDSEKII